MLNPTWLITFKNLVELGSFTKTADKLYMTQPGVSQHVRKLEDRCGKMLLHRDKKQVELTEQGRILYQYVLQWEKEQAKLLESINFDNPFAGVCKLACSGSLALRLYPQLIKLQVEYPAMIMQLEAAPNRAIRKNIQSGELDIGIVTQIDQDNLFDYQQVGDEELCLVYPKKITWENQTDLSPQLSRLGLVNHPDAIHYLSLYLAQCQDPRLAQLNANEVPIVGYINQLAQILVPVAQGIGFTVLPKSAIDIFEQNAELEILSPKHKVTEKLYTITARNRQLPARYHTIAQQLAPIF